MLDYGCGEALAADRVAEPVARLILCEPAPNVRAMLGARFAGNDKIAVRKPEDVALMPAQSFDVIVMHSVTQYLTARELDALMQAVPPPAQARRPAGVGDVIPRKVSALADAAALLRFGQQEGFYLGALSGLSAPIFPTTGGCANHSACRATTRPKSRPSSRPRASRRNRARSNIGHNNKRMTFLAHAR